MEEERRLELILPGTGSVVWCFRGAVAAAHFDEIRKALDSGRDCPGGPVVTKISVRHLPFPTWEELNWESSNTIRWAPGLSARMPEENRVEILLHQTAYDTPEQNVLILQRSVWYGLLPLILQRKALILHGALLAKGDRGVVLCGASGSGKSTCARRVAGSWRALADDAVLVSCSGKRFYAQPLPTWSQLLPGGVPQPAAVNQAVELTGIYHLRQAREDRLQELIWPEKINVVIQSFFDFRRIWKIRSKDVYRKELCASVADFAQHATHNLQFGRLDCSLDGEFWKILDR